MNTISAQEAFNKAFHTELGLLGFFILEDNNPNSDGLYMVQDMAPSGNGFEISYGHSSGWQDVIWLPADFLFILPNNFSMEG